MIDVSSLSNPLIIQARVIFALVLRETRLTFGASQLGYIWAIVTPIIITMVLTGIFAFIGRHPPIGTSYFLFFATGMITFELNSKLRGSLMNVFEQNKSLLSYPLVKAVDVVLARSILIFLTYCLVFILVFMGTSYFELGGPPFDVLNFIAAVVVTTALGMGLGVINALIFRFWETWKPVEGILSRPLFFVSGIFFIPSEFSHDIQWYFYWNPISHCIEWVREAYYQGYDSSLLDKRYLIIFTLASMLVGIGGERLYQKHRI